MDCVLHDGVASSVLPNIPLKKKYKAFLEREGYFECTETCKLLININYVHVKIPQST